MPLGTVTNIYRAGVPGDDSGRPQLLANIDGVGTQVPATYYGSPPPPLTVCEFSGGPIWHCDGMAYGDSRVILHEDFLRVPTTTGTSTTSITCDTNWRCTLGVSSSVSQAGQLGAANCVATGAASRSAIIRKEDNCFAYSVSPLWLSARVYATTNDTLCDIGFLPDAVTNYALMQYSASGTGKWSLEGSDGTTASSNNAATGPDAVNYQHLDLVLVAGSFIAGWVNGDGPYFSTTGLPTTAQTGTVWFRSLTIAGATVGCIAEYIRIEAPTLVVNPATDERLQPAAV